MEKAIQALWQEQRRQKWKSRFMWRTNGRKDRRKDGRANGRTHQWLLARQTEMCLIESRSLRLEKGKEKKKERKKIRVITSGVRNGTRSGNQPQ